MRILCTQQNTDEWELARKGRVTASMIDKVLAGKHTKGRFEYMLNLIMDLEGVADFKDVAPWFLKGKKYERDALGWYQVETDQVVHTTGFVLHDSFNWFGCSPDGLVGNDGMVEMKYRSTPTTFEDAYYRNESGTQEQGHIRLIERDDAKIRELEEAALVFWLETVRKWKHRTGKEMIEFPMPTPAKLRK